jgi:hypothetical protein
MNSQTRSRAAVSGEGGTTGGCRGRVSRPGWSSADQTTTTGCFCEGEVRVDLPSSSSPPLAPPSPAPQEVGSGETGRTWTERAGEPHVIVSHLRHSAHQLRRCVNTRRCTDHSHRAERWSERGGGGLLFDLMKEQLDVDGVIRVATCRDGCNTRT